MGEGDWTGENLFVLLMKAPSAYSNIHHTQMRKTRDFIKTYLWLKTTNMRRTCRVHEQNIAIYSGLRWINGDWVRWNQQRLEDWIPWIVGLKKECTNWPATFIKASSKGESNGTSTGNQGFQPGSKGLLLFYQVWKVWVNMSGMEHQLLMIHIFFGTLWFP